MIQIPEIDGPAPLSAEALVAGARLGNYSNLIVGFTPPGCLALIVGGTFVGLYLSLVWSLGHPVGRLGRGKPPRADRLSTYTAERADYWAGRLGSACLAKAV